MNKIIKDSMENMQTFYKQVEILLKSIRSGLVNHYDYDASRDNRIAFEASNSFNEIASRIPPYVTMYLKKSNRDSEYISISIIFIKYWGDKKPLNDYSLIIGKYYEVTHPEGLSWYNKDLMYHDLSKHPEVTFLKKETNYRKVLIEPDKEAPYHFEFERADLLKTSLFSWADIQKKLRFFLKELSKLSNDYSAMGIEADTNRIPGDPTDICYNKIHIVPLDVKLINFHRQHREHLSPDLTCGACAESIGEILERAKAGIKKCEKMFDHYTIVVHNSEALTKCREKKYHGYLWSCWMNFEEFLIIIKQERLDKETIIEYE